MKVDPRALQGIDRKITRAHEHLRVLYDEMAAWDARRPWRLVPEVHNQGRKHFYRLRFLEPIPVDWAVVLGEVIHDLRSALDQAVYWLTVDWNKAALRGSQFPVYTRTANFYQRDKKGRAWSSSGGMYKIRGVGPGPQAFIEALQPYPQRYRRFFCRDLRTVHDLWNQDKHRLVHLWGLRFKQPQLALEQRVHADCVIYHDGRVLHDGAIPLKIACNPPHPEVKVKGTIAATLSLYAGKRAGGGRLSLWDTYSTLSDVIRKLTCAIGRQTEPISLNVWSKATYPCPAHYAPASTEI